MDTLEDKLLEKRLRDQDRGDEGAPEPEPEKCPDCGGEDFGWQHREWDTDSGHGEVEFKECRECHQQWDHS